MMLVDIAFLVKFYYLSQESSNENLRSFRKEKKMSTVSGPISVAGLIPHVRRFEEIVSVKEKDSPRRSVSEFSSGPYIRCGLVNGHFKGTVNGRGTSTEM
ncbi:hypothetical protein TNIN_449121 [Trichonephila inaurata madagascariensis]|uniref:Uncharacterized protein n=1 Tax=Trichonephila inaurata madagascariensis TaxID=2747483 RepID=A0A8X6YJX8_9ARAC|nr:hypothetical protein TNIN_449121 [Trichonephila inaurata madagascariensis]